MLTSKTTPQKSDTALTVFHYESKEVRATIIDGEPYFVGKDVALVLGYKNPQEAIREHVDEEDKGVSEMLTPGGKQKMPVVNESGVYALIFASKLPEAKKFKHWVTHEVLPSIRKTGSYLSQEDKAELDKLRQERFLVQDQLNRFLEPPYQVGGLPEAPSPARRLFAQSPYMPIESLAKVLTVNNPDHLPVTANSLLIWLRQCGYLSVDPDTWNQPTTASLERKLFATQPVASAKTEELQPVCTPAGLEHLLALQREAYETFTPQTEKEILQLIKQTASLRELEQEERGSGIASA